MSRTGGRGDTTASNKVKQNQQKANQSSSTQLSDASASDSEMKTRRSSQKETPTRGSSSKSKKVPAAKVTENSRQSKKSSTKPHESEDDDDEDLSVLLSDQDPSSGEDEEEDEELAKPSAKPRTKTDSSAQVVQRLQTKFDKDHAMSAKKIKSVEAKFAKLQDEHQSNIKDYNDLLADYNDLQSLHEEVSVKYKESLSTTAGKKKDDEDKNDFMVQQIYSCMKRIKWRTIKFVGNDEQLLQISVNCLDHLNMRDYTHKEGENDARAALIDQRRDEWVALYGTDVRGAVNEQRSYVQSEQKKLALFRLKGCKVEEIAPKELPTVAEMWQVVQRNLESEVGETTKRNEELFDWWLDHVGVAAGSTYFGKKMRRTQNLSTAVSLTDGKLCVPPSTEAIAFLMYENCRDKWIEMHKWREVEGNSGDIPKYSKKFPDTHRFKAKYSDSHTGQSPYGGWGSAGIKRFNQLKKAFTDMRVTDKERLEAVESAAVLRCHIRAVEDRKKKLQQNGQDVPEDDAILGKTKRGKKRKTPTEEVVLAVNDEE